ncbi:hypothetical protein E2C01_063453 [Portunus trituberculatus]|uniref:Uncharacterized protein n=1 Tax=Portunus trituberculatus TaxID=210409 RepID=A0A5B7HH30_PORTR|nr:hypothetical protein [Portunus trituberculatus]
MPAIMGAGRADTDHTPHLHISSRLAYRRPNFTCKTPKHTHLRGPTTSLSPAQPCVPTL